MCGIFQFPPGGKVMVVVVCMMVDSEEGSTFILFSLSEFLYMCKVNRIPIPKKKTEIWWGPEGIIHETEFGYHSAITYSYCCRLLFSIRVHLSERSLLVSYIFSRKTHMCWIYSGSRYAVVCNIYDHVIYFWGSCWLSFSNIVMIISINYCSTGIRCASLLCFTKTNYRCLVVSMVGKSTPRMSWDKNGYFSDIIRALIFLELILHFGTQHI